MLTKGGTKNPIAGMGGGWVPQQKTGYAFSVSVPGIDDTIFQFAMKSMTLPMTGEVEIKEVKWMNEIRKYAAGPVKFNTMTLKLNDYVDKKVMEAMQAWHKLVYNPADGSIGNVSDYKRDGTITLGVPNSSGIPDRVWSAHGCIPKVVKMGDGEMGNGDQVEVEVTIECDWIDMIP
jgi:hypothetical protein